MKVGEGRLVDYGHNNERFQYILLYSEQSDKISCEISAFLLVLKIKLDRSSLACTDTKQRNRYSK